MIRIDLSTMINRPIEDVFEYATGVKNQPEWASGVLEAEQTSEGPFGVGSTYRLVRRLLGRRIEVTFEVTEYESNKKYGFKSTSGPVSVEGSQSFDSVEGKTRITLAMEGDPRGFFKLAEPILAGIVKRQFEGDLHNMKDLLDAQAEGTT